MEEFELVDAGGYKFENWASEKKWHFSEISDCQDTGAKNANRQISRRKTLYKNFFGSDPDQKVKAYIFGEIWVVVSRDFNITTFFFLEISNNQDTIAHARKKNNEFLVEDSSTGAVFLIQILMK